MKKILMPTSYDNCSGCGLCKALCSENAITMYKNERGFYNPRIDEEKCINCGMCYRLCPSDKAYDTVLGDGMASKVYAANNKDDNIRLKSASGGIFSAFASEVLYNGGFVSGCIFNDDFSVKHILHNDMDYLKKIRGTKYLQSDMSDIFSDIEEKLMQNTTVLFCGTPCQVMAVKRYCQIRKIDEKLILIDLLCRGVPSPGVFSKWIEYLENGQNAKITSVYFKDKINGWHNPRINVYFEDGSVSYWPNCEGLYINSFLIDNISVCDSCFHCKYKSINRVGDITIGDFWGLKNCDLLDEKGTSAVIINTRKGELLFNDIMKYINIRPSNMHAVTSGNPWAFKQLPDNRQCRQVFYDLLNKGYDLEYSLNEARNTV